MRTELRPGRARVLATFVVNAPLAFVLVAAALVAAAVASASVDAFLPYVTLPIAALLACVAFWLMPTVRPDGRLHVLASGIVTVGAAVWVVAQWAFPTEYLRPARDQGIYTVTGRWMADHGTPSIDISGGHAAVEGISGFSTALGNFEASPDLSVYLQGGDAAPAVFALGVWLGGTDGGLRAAMLMGAVSILAVYELSRRFVKSPLFGLLPPILLATGVPLSYFSRAPFTELVALAFFAAGLAVLASALREGGRRQFVLAGFLVGVGAMARIDTPLPLALVLLVFPLGALGFARAPSGTSWMRALTLFGAPALVFFGVGLLDLAFNYSRYLADQGWRAMSLWVLLGVVTLLSVVVVAVCGRRFSRDRLVSPRASRAWWVAGGALVTAVFLFWFSRPFWLIYHRTVKPTYQTHVANIQAATGLPIEPSRSYDEYSLWWFAWYLGWAAVVLIIAGMVLLVRRALRSHDGGALALVTTTMGVAFLYLNLISISPDQVWGFRRVLPVITPGFLVAVAVAIAWLWQVRRAKVVAQISVVLAIVLLLVGVRMGWGAPLFALQSQGGALEETRFICAQLDEAEADVAVADVTRYGAATLRVFCGVDVVMFADGDPEVRRASLEALAERRKHVVVVTEFPDSVRWADEVPAATRVQDITEWRTTLVGAPEVGTVTERSTWIAVVDANGLLAAR